MGWMLLEKALKPFNLPSFSIQKGKRFASVFTHQMIISSVLTLSSFCIQEEKAPILLQHCFTWWM